MKDDINSYSQSRLSVVARLIDGLSGILGIIIFVSFLDLSNLGRYYILVSVAQTTVSPIQGISTSVKHMVNREDKNNPYKNIISAGILASITLATIFILVGFIFYYTLLIEFYKIYNTEIILVVSFILLKSVLFVVMDAYRGLGYPSRAMFLLAGRGIVQTILQIIFLIAFGWGINGLLGGSIVAISLLLLYLLSVDEINIGYPKIDLKFFYNYSKWAIPQKFTSNLSIRVDDIILGILVSSSAVGIYNSIIKITRATTYISGAINHSVFVKFSKSVGSYPIKDLNINGSYVGILSLPMFFGSIIIGNDFLTYIYNAEFTAGYYILVFGCLYVFIRSNSNLIENSLNGSGNPEKATLYQIFSILVFFVSSYIFINYYGLNGIIISLTITEICRFLLLINGFKKITGSYYYPSQIKYQIISSLVMSVFVYVSSLLLQSSSFLNLVLLILIGSICYTIMMIILDSSVRKFITDFVEENLLF